MENGVGKKRHFVLVHGLCHGRWCWYKLATLLASAGHEVTAPDLAACGTDTRRLDEVGTFSDGYSRPLMEVMGAVPPGERVVLVGHSFGGMSIALAMERFPEKVAAAIFVAALAPDTSSSTPANVVDVLLKRHPPEWMDCRLQSLDRGPNNKPLPSILFGPDFLSSQLYQNCCPEDITLALSLIRVGSMFQEDISGEPPFTEARYGSVNKAYVVCDEDRVIPGEFQLWMAEKCGVDEVKVMEGVDHMPMLSKPQELCRHLLDVAEMYG